MGEMGKRRIGRFREGKGPIEWGVSGELNSAGGKQTTNRRTGEYTGKWLNVLGYLYISI